MQSVRRNVLLLICLMITAFAGACGNAQNGAGRNTVYARSFTFPHHQQLKVYSTETPSVTVVAPPGGEAENSAPSQAVNSVPTVTAAPSATPANNGGTGSQGASGADPRFQPVFDEEFQGTSIDTTKWVPYYGPSTDKTYAFNAIACQIGGGELTLKVLDRAQDGRQFTTCGLGTWQSLVQTYGKYEFRARTDRGAGWSGVGLLWPQAKHWPPEIDMCEYNDARDDCAFTLHYDSDNKRQAKHISGDFTQWHVYTVEWTPGHLRWLVDGQVRFETSNNVPAEPMWFGIQVGTFENVANLGAYHVDWIHIYKYTG